MGEIVQKALCEKPRMFPRGKLIVGDTRVMGFCESTREAKGRTQRAKADIMASELWDWGSKKYIRPRGERGREEEKRDGGSLRRCKTDGLRERLPA